MLAAAQRGRTNIIPAALAATTGHSVWMERQLRAAGLLTAGVVATVVVVVLGVRAQDSSPSSEPATTFICADVGLRGPSASTPRDAFGAFIGQRGGNPSDWKQIHHSATPPFDDYTFAPKHGAALSGFTRVSVREQAGVSTASGGCVG